MPATNASVEVYQLRVVLRGINPLIWRRFLTRGDTTIADLHDILQIVMGWEDMHLHRFHIRGRDYGISYSGGLWFDDDPDTVALGDLGLRLKERFLYEYDMGDLWQHELRLEARLPWEPRQRYPRCVGGKRAAPPEDCGGAWAYMGIQDALEWDCDPDALDDVYDEDENPLRQYAGAAARRFDRHRINAELHRWAASKGRRDREGEAP